MEVQILWEGNQGKMDAVANDISLPKRVQKVNSVDF